MRLQNVNVYVWTGPQIHPFQPVFCVVLQKSLWYGTVCVNRQQAIMSIDVGSH